MTLIAGSGYFIYKQAMANQEASYSGLISLIYKQTVVYWWAIPLLISLSLLNWGLEILKWKRLVNPLYKIPYKEASIQSLSAHTLSLLAPFKAGEYVAKALYYPKRFRAKIAYLNFIGNMYQLLVSLVFGLVGFFFFSSLYSINIQPHKLRFIGAIIAFFILFVTAAKTASYKSTYFHRIHSFFSTLSRKDNMDILLLSLTRYLLFSHQYYLMMYFFGIDVPYTTAMLLIFTMYFLASLLPIMNLFDFLIKGSVALYLFKFVGADPLLIFSVSISMWILNFVLPALVGSYYVIRFQPQYKTSLV